MLLLLLMGGAATALLAPDASEAHPGLPGYEANQTITRTYGNGGYQRPLVPVLTLPPGLTVDSPEAREALGRAFASAGHAVQARVASYANTGDRQFVGRGGRITFGLVFAGPVRQDGQPGGALEEADLGRRITAAMCSELPRGTTLQMTGLDSLATGGGPGDLNVPLKLTLMMIGAAIAVLLFVFRSALAFVPLLTAFVAIPAAFAGLLLVSPFGTVHETTTVVLPLFGIGVAVNHALILVGRWREERGRGVRGDTAVHRAMAMSGHVVLFSAGAVALGLSTMLVLPVPLLRSLGIGGMMVAATSALVSLTLLPLVLSACGRRMQRPRAAGGTRLVREASPSRAWTT